VPFRERNCRKQCDAPEARAEEGAFPLRSGPDPENSICRLRLQQRCPQRRRPKNGELSMGINTFMRELIDPYWFTVALTSLVQFVLFLRWLYRRIRNDEMTRTFVEDMATSHLPHIYRLLEKRCDEKGIETPPEPPIRWVNLNGPHH
jgi:hypothetical protein